MVNLRQLIFGLVMTGVFVASASPARADICGQKTTTPLMAGQTFTAGSISISNDQNNIYVQYNTVSPWVMSDAHVAVASSLAGIPQTKAGNPIPGRFAYSATFDPEVTTYTFGIPVGTLANSPTVFVAAHAMVQAPKSAGGSQTGWGSGPDFPGANWAMYVGYAMQPCSAVE